MAQTKAETLALIKEMIEQWEEGLITDNEALAKILTLSAEGYEPAE